MGCSSGLPRHHHRGEPREGHLGDPVIDELNELRAGVWS
jgi:hypothetical protein